MIFTYLNWIKNKYPRSWTFIKSRAPRKSKGKSIITTQDFGLACMSDDTSGYSLIYKENIKTWRMIYEWAFKAVMNSLLYR